MNKKMHEYIGHKYLILSIIQQDTQIVQPFLSSLNE